MILSIDIGNSALKYAVYDKNVKTAFKRINFNDFTDDCFAKYDFDEVVISSVVPERKKFIHDHIVEKYNIEPLVISKDLSFGISLNYNSTETLGLDRIAAAVGSYNLAKEHDENCPILFIDFGTATTVNLISPNGIFQGGLIIPGLYTMLRSLFTNTAQLPSIDLSGYKSFIGKSTEECIRSGILNSTLSLLDKSVEIVKSDYETEKVKVFVTGGNRKYVMEQLNFEFEEAEDLVNYGAMKLFELNVKG